MNSLATLRRKLFGIPERETRFSTRGFEGGTATTRNRIEQIGSTFAQGYHAALEETRTLPLAQRLDGIEPERRGFAYEGAAMALALLDLLTPWQGQRFRNFLGGPGAAHTYMLHVGVGWALARLPRRVEPNLKRFDPLLRWLILDGYGFHQGYFHWRRFLSQQKIPAGLSPYARRAFDQGLGRSLWFVRGAEVARVVAALEGFPQGRQGDLWSGLGLASAYAGGVPETELTALCNLAGPYLPQLAQGVAFAAKARELAGNPTGHTEAASRIICGLSAREAAAVTDETLQKLPTDEQGQPTYEHWRLAIQERFTVVTPVAQSAAAGRLL